METREKPVDTEAEVPLPTSPTERKEIAGTRGAAADGGAAKRRVVIGKRKAGIAPRSGGLAPLTVIGDDERSRIRETTLSPYRMICALRIESPWGTFVGSGWVVGPRTIVTAGHCVVDRSLMGGWATSIHVTPGQDDAEAPFGAKVATRFVTVDRWLDARDPDFDIGAIQLDEPLDGSIGAFSVAALTDEDLQDYMVNISGYPARPGGGRQQWWAMNRIRAVTPRRIFYEVDTSGGQSGGPVYIYEDEDPETPKVIGIHAYGIGGTPADIPLTVNSAPRLIPEVVEQIDVWRRSAEMVG